MIRLQTLGPLELQDSEGNELRSILAQPRRLALLAYLAAAAPTGFHRRDAILPLFWPEHDAERARAALNRAVYFLRHELGDGVLISRGDEEIGLARDRFWCDAMAFDEAVDEGRYTGAIELYRGDLLPGFFVSAAPGFELWLDARRARLRERASNTAWSLAEQEEAAGNVDAAVSWARRGVELAPFQELSFRRLLTLLDRAGDRTGAAHAYARFADEIAAALDVSPSPETQSLIELIRSRTRSANGHDSLGTSEPAVAHENAVAAVMVEPTSPPAGAVPNGRQRVVWRRRRLMAAATVVVIAIAGVARIASPAKSIDALRVDFARWENRTGNRSLDRLGLLAANRMLSGVKQTGLVEELALAGSSRREGAAGTLVSGSFERDGDALTFHAVVTDVRRGRKEWQVAPVSTPAELAEQALDTIRSRVVAAVAVLRDPQHATLLPVASAPPAFDAYQEFLEAGKLQAEGKIHDALLHYRWAAAIDTTFTWPLVRAGMSSLYYYKGGDLSAQVDSFIALLNGIRDRLPPLQHHLLDHMSAVRAEDWDAAYRARRAAAHLAPYEYSLGAAVGALQRNRPREALELLDVPGLDSIHRRNVQVYWRTRTLSLHLIDEHRTELVLAHMARRNAPQSLHALFTELRALAALGHVPAVNAGLDTMLALPLEGWFTPPLVMEGVATELRAHGHADAASAVFARAIGWLNSRPPQERVTQERREDLARLLYLAGRFDDADTLYQALVRQYPTSVGYPDNVWYVGYLGLIAARRGDSTRAREIAVQLKAKERAQPLPGQEAVVFRAKIAAQLGDYEEATRLLIGAYGASGSTELHGDLDLEGIRSYPPFREFIKPKG